jgi:DNA-binding transcriptional ArsR family regulator
MSTVPHRLLKSEGEIAAYLHKTRMDILRVLRDGQATSSQIAAKLGVHPANLTRHIRILERAGLIALIEKRDTGKNLEKYYEAGAMSFDVDAGTEGLASPHKLALAFARSDLTAALAQSPAREPREVVALVANARIPTAALGRFSRALASLVESFTKADDRGGEPYHLNVSLYPGDIQPQGKRVTLRRKERQT